MKNPLNPNNMVTLYTDDDILINLTQTEDSILQIEGDFVGVPIPIPMYDGPYQILPSNEKQTLNTSGKQFDRDIVVKPIPKNYGLISWNGSVLTVS